MASRKSGQREFRIISFSPKKFEFPANRHESAKSREQQANARFLEVQKIETAARLRDENAKRQAEEARKLHDEVVVREENAHK